MKKLVLFLGLLGSFGATSALGQQINPPAKTEFLDSAYVVLPSAAGARYRREIAPTDSVGAVVRFYAMPGKLVSVRSFEHFRKGILDGVSERWHDNGQIQFHEEFMHGKRSGVLRTYYSNGQLKRRETYDAKGSDFASTGECFGEDGQPVPFFQFEQMPIYSVGDGGSKVVVYAIQRAVKYPRDALKAGKSGKVIVSFNVTDEGKVADIKVVQGVYPSLDAAVVQAVQQLKPFKPGHQDGKPVAVAYTLPITFAIQ
ncbi:TonB family protein [Hymenobacter sp. BT683]|uniref:TonB family protein n=1 Tax=Hymenobacter jeongseonensis TaxID=2791027 RepID=A0ABS0IKM8_9BACT|nr:energy transducer TonB [Hymenobacter jeongseonensis]MBF9238888.1 TonB family protein [Hymenobacter jeongseonensis]